MKLRKAAALPGAIIICTLLLIISITVTSLVMQSATNVLVGDSTEQKLSDFADYFNKFKETGDASLISSTRYDFKTYNGENQVKALVACEKSSETVVFYAIYDFDSQHTQHTLAYQTSDFYIEDKEGVNYLAGIVPMVEE